MEFLRHKCLVIRQFNVIYLGALACLIPQPGQPVIDTAPLGKGICNTHLCRNPAQDVIIIARHTGRFSRFGHAHKIGVERGHGDIPPFQRHRTGQHDIGKFGSRVPTPVMDDNRVRLFPGPPHAVQVLMMVKRVTPGPVNDAGIGIAISLAIIVKCRARVQQHVADPRNRDEIRHRVPALWHSRIGYPRHIVAHMVGDGVSKSDPAPGQPDLAKQGCQRNGRPEGLFTPLLPAERPADADHGALACHFMCQSGDISLGNAGQRRSPRSVFHHTVRLPVQIGHEFAIANRITFNKGAINKTIPMQHMAQCQQQSRIGIRAHRHPSRRDVTVNIHTAWRDIHKLHT